MVTIDSDFKKKKKAKLKLKYTFCVLLMAKTHVFLVGKMKEVQRFVIVFCFVSFWF